MLRIENEEHNAWKRKWRTQCFESKMKNKTVLLFRFASERQTFCCYRCNVFPQRKLICTKIAKTRTKTRRPRRSPGRRPPFPGYGWCVCVFLCIPSFICNESPVRSETSRKENFSNIQQYPDPGRDLYFLTIGPRCLMQLPGMSRNIFKCSRLHPDTVHRLTNRCTGNIQRNSQQALDVLGIFIHEYYDAALLRIFCPWMKNL